MLRSTGCALAPGFRVTLARDLRECGPRSAQGTPRHTHSGPSAPRVASPRQPEPSSDSPSSALSPHNRHVRFRLGRTRRKRRAARPHPPRTAAAPLCRRRARRCLRRCAAGRAIRCRPAPAAACRGRRWQPPAIPSAAAAAARLGMRRRQARCHSVSPQQRTRFTRTADRREEPVLLVRVRCVRGPGARGLLPPASGDTPCTALEERGGAGGRTRLIASNGKTPGVCVCVCARARVRACGCVCVCVC